MGEEELISGRAEPLAEEASSLDEARLALAARVAFHVVKTERGPERQPPNHHDLHIYACIDGSEASGLLDAHTATPAKSIHSVSLAPSTSAGAGAARCSRPRAVRRVDVPGVPGAFVMLDVLSAAECTALLVVAERMGFADELDRHLPDS